MIDWIHFIKKRTVWLIAAVLLACAAYAEWDSDSENKQTANLSSKPSAKQAEPAKPALTLQPYDGGFFTIEKPAGWHITTGGQGATLAIWLQDPQEPARQCFLFGAVGPFYLSSQQQTIDRNYLASGGYPIPWADMPVVSPPTASNFLQQWNALTQTAMARQFMSKLPRFEDLSIISVQPIQGYDGKQTELVRALFKINGKVAEGLFTTTIIEYMPFVSNMPGGHQGYAVRFTGITAPKTEFAHVQPQLLRSLSSFTLSEQYVQSSIQSSQQAFASVMRAGQTLRETSDMIYEGWKSRQKSYDVMAEKRSDAILGKERVRDPQTGDVYEFDLGWYDQYNTRRNQYNKPNLEPLADNDYNSWTQGTLDGRQHVHPQ